MHVYTECWWITCGPFMSSAGPYAHPVFHPVTEKVFPAEPMVMVRSHMPGNVAGREKATGYNSISARDLLLPLSNLLASV